MPTTQQRLFGALASVVITVGGAWVASQAHTGSQEQALTSFPDGLNLTFNGVRSDVGNIVVIVFADRAAFKAYDVTNAVAYRQVSARVGDVTVSFPSLTRGPYAVAAFHDADQNQDLNMEGEQPVEGYGTSGAVDRYDTPTFRKAALMQGNATIKMFYFSE